MICLARVAARSELPRGQPRPDCFDRYFESGQNYRLDQTIVSVSEPRGGSGFSAGTIRFEPARGEGSDRRGGGRIYKVEMTEYGYGYKIGDDDNASFADIIQFEGDGADLNEDGFQTGGLILTVSKTLEAVSSLNSVLILRF